MDCSLDLNQVCIKELEIVIGKKKLVVLLLLKSVLFISAIVINVLMEGSTTQLKIAPVLYMLFNLAVFNTLFFLPLFFIKFKKRKVLQKSLLGIFFGANTLLLWYFTITDIKYLVALLLTDVLLFNFFLSRKLNY